MIPSGLSSSNRVKSIKSRFEVLSDQSKHGEPDIKLQNNSTVPLNLKKVGNCKESTLQKYRHFSDSSHNEHPSNNLFDSNNTNSKDHLGASANFGNRKRLKECGKYDEYSHNESLAEVNNQNVNNDGNKAMQDVRCNSVTDDISYDDVKENLSVNGCQKSLSRHHSDPVKKLHRSPAFRCERSEKIRDSRKNSFNSDCSDQGAPSIETDRCRLSRDKLKRLGFLLEEKMKQDNFEFSKPKNKSSALQIQNFEENILLNKLSDTNRNFSDINKKIDNISPEKSLQDIKEKLKPIVYSGVVKNNKTGDSKHTHEAINDDLQIPKHILDQYAQVIKPKNRNAFMRKTPHTKTDIVLSDSGVSSESENLISDDLDESETSPKTKNFKALCSNFEVKHTQGRDDLTNKRKFLRRPSEEKKISEGNSSKENLLENDILNVKESIKVTSFDNSTFISKSNDDIKTCVTEGFLDIGMSDTLKKVLQQPLPPGPPPKKPPRTFAATEPGLPIKNQETDCQSSEFVKSKYQKNGGKIKSYKNRTKEESKIMLEKIENALHKHENGGKILSPRTVRKEKLSKTETLSTDSWTRLGTKPSTAKLKKSHKKGDSGNTCNESTPKELHYMCTEILDLNCPEKEHILNSSNASLNSAESFNTTNSFTKCFNSLNCANTNVRHSSGMNYSKLDTSLNSTTASLNNMCCTCNFVSPKEKLKSSRNSMDEFSPPGQTRRLSTFLPSPSKSTENLNMSNNVCDTCSNNPTDHFVCHINSSNASNRSFSPHNESQSVFFIDRKSDSKLEGSPQYGVLKKSKSQEHIYAEPFEFKRLTAKHLNMESNEPIPKSDSSGNVPLFTDKDSMKPPLIRMRTQLEDGFGKIREVDSTRVFNANLKTHIETTATYGTSFSKKPDVELHDDNNIKNMGCSTKRSETLQDKVGLDDCSKNENKSSKVKDILMRLESGRASLRIEKYKRNDDTRKSLAVRSNTPSSRNVFSTVAFNRLPAVSNGQATPTELSTPDVPVNLLHYSSTKIYDTPESVEISDQKPQDFNLHKTDLKPLSVNSSFLYGLEKAKQKNDKVTLNGSQRNGKENFMTDEVTGNFRRPPLYERKVTTAQSGNLKARRPHSLYLMDNGNTTKSGGVTFTEPRRRRSPTEVDKEHLSRLMTEIYDTVAEACILEGNTATPSGDSEQDTSDDVSLKLTRSLTEKRKRYVRRVTSRVGFLSEDSTRYRRQESADDDSGNDIPDHETDANIKAYSTFPSRQSIKNASFLHSKINKENNMADSSCSDRTTQSETDKQDSRKEIITKGGGLFDACVLVGMNFSTGQAYIKNIYPEMVVIPPQIESLVFPESVTNVSGDVKSRPMRICDEAADVQCYALVLTNEKGLRTYGYCRRVLPEGATHCLPLSYCIISRHRAPAFYYKVLKEIECRHGSSDNVVNSVLSQLYAAEFPKPGYSVNIKQVRSPKRLVVHDGSFKKSSPYRNSVNLGDVLKSGSYEEFSGMGISNSSSQSLLVDKDCDKFRRKSSGISANFPELNSSDLSVMKSLEKIYGENLREFKSDFVDKKEPQESTSGTASVDRDLASRSSNINLKSSCGDSTENIPSESSEGYRNYASSQDSDPEDTITSKEYCYGVRSDGLDIVQIKRPLEPRLDEDNLSVLFESISVSNLVKIFGTLIIERKVVIICDKLSKLSSCIEALQSILYPLTWQHTLVSSIPRDMTRDILEAPIPILAGLLLPLSVTTSKHPNSELDKIHFEEGMLIDISNGEERVIKVQGDESTLLPPLLAKTLKASLQLGPPITTPSSPSDEHARKTRNVLVAEAFLRFFVEVLGDCKNYFGENSGSPSSPVCGYKGKFKFEKEQFIRSFRSKHIQYFLEWFTETAMFNTYIQQRSLLMSLDQPTFNGKPDVLSTSMMDLPYPDFYEMFDERVSRKGTSQSARAQLNNAGKESVSKGNYKMIVNKKVKVWRDKLRDLVS